MLDWLKGILGDVHTDEIEKKVEAELGKHFVPRSEFNAANEAKKVAEGEIAKRDTQIEALGKTTGNAEALKTQIDELKTQNATDKAAYEADLNKLKIDGIVEKELAAAGAKNVKAVRALLDLTDAKVNEAGEVVGLKDKIKALTDADDSKFLFNESDDGAKDDKTQMKGFKPGEKGDTGGAEPPKSLADAISISMGAKK